MCGGTACQTWRGERTRSSHCYAIMDEYGEQVFDAITEDPDVLIEVNPRITESQADFIASMIRSTQDTLQTKVQLLSIIGNKGLPKLT